jgi:hypothetical protein
MARNTGITQRSVTSDGVSAPFTVDADHMSAYGCLGWRSAFHHRGFHTPSGQWLEVWWTTDNRTGEIIDIFEDTRGLNFK